MHDLVLTGFTLASVQALGVQVMPVGAEHVCVAQEEGDLQ